MTSQQPPAGPPAVRVTDLHKTYTVPGRDDSEVRALDGVTVSLPAASFTAVVGASGSGKSTFLHCAAGLDLPTSGQVELLGTDTTALSPRRRAAHRAAAVGFVFQEYNLISSLTAYDNVALPARLAGRRLSRRVVREALESVELMHRAGQRPHQLSGGERQRVAIARVMASGPQIVFADEPTGSLDVESSALIFTWLRALAASGTTVVLVTHDVEAAAKSDTVLVMHAGRIVASTCGGDPGAVARLLHGARTGELAGLVASR